MIRERDMLPGLSTHIPETVVYADETALDVETYIQPFNLMGYLMQLEWTGCAGSSKRAKKPVITIKTMVPGNPPTKRWSLPGMPSVSATCDGRHDGAGRGPGANRYVAGYPPGPPVLGELQRTKVEEHGY